ncbi:MAG: helicase-exonuclease AddAB subunit AddB [Bacillota bacterium]|nr:helicase-exonuclease AddAB subunit AddB [Bacillota bacterium]
MSLRFIYGRAGSGKSCYCIEEMKKKIEQNFDRPLIFIIPEQFSFQSEKNILKLIGEMGSFKIKVLSFKRMAYKVFNEVGGITHEHMNSSGKSMLIYNLLEELREDFKIFSTAAKKQGFVNSIADSISEFKKYNITPDMLNETFERTEDNEVLKDKLHDLSLIYREFNNTLHKGYIDSDDDLTMLMERIEKSRQFDGAEIWIDEFSSFTPQQYAIIEKLLRKCKRINITLNSDYNGGNREYDLTNVFSAVRYTENKLIEIAAHNNISLDKPIILNKRPYPKYKESYEMGFLEENLYSYPYEVYTKDLKDISLFKAANIYSEVENTARDIIRLCREEGYRFKDIAVISRNLENYDNLISAIFGEYDIPYFIDKKKDISGNLLVVFITSVIEIFTKNWSYEAVFRYLKTGLPGIEREDIDILENYVLASGIKGRKKWLEEVWEYRNKNSLQGEEISEQEKQIIKMVNEIRDRVVKPLISFYSFVRGRKSAREKCESVYDFLVNLGVPDRVSEWIDKFREQGKQILVNEYSQIWNTIIEVLDQTVEVLGDEKISLDRFMKILTIGFNENKMGLIPPSLDEVLVSSIERVKSHDIKALYIIGVNDGIFPKTSYEEGILTDAERDILKSRGVELAKSTKIQAFEEQFLVYTALTIPSNYLRISYPIADFEGKALRPSIIISRLKVIFPRILELNDIMQGEYEEGSMQLVSAPTPTFNELVGVLRKKFDGYQEDPFWKDVYKWFMSKDVWREKCERVFSGVAYSNQVNLIKREKVKKLYGENLHFSVSRLEKYVECPFAYYIQYGLKAKEREVFKLSSPDLGTFMHTVIDEFSKCLSKEGMDWEELDKNWCQEAVSAIVDEASTRNKGFILNSSPRYEYLSTRLKRVLTRTVMLIAEHIKRSGFRPVGYELSFKERGDYPPIIVELPSGEKVNLIGRIDRIDVMQKDGETYIRVVDYKSGSKVFKLSDVYYGLQVQLMLYLDAILQNESRDIEDNATPAGILYFKIDDPMISSNKRLSDEEIELEIMKRLKMKGLLLADEEIIKEMDRNLEGNSLIIPARLNKNGSLGKSSVATVEQFDMLRNHVRNKLIDSCEEMLNGNISIKPCKRKNNVPCDYCLYHSICQFDAQMKNNYYNNMREKSDEEIWRLLQDEKEKEVKRDE